MSEDNNQQQNEAVPMTAEWGTATVDSIKKIPALCAQAMNTGWTVFGIYPVAKALSENHYDVVVYRVRQLTDEEKAKVALAKAGIQVP